MHHAVEKGSYETVKLLIDSLADPNVQNFDKISPTELAKSLLSGNRRNSDCHRIYSYILENQNPVWIKGFFFF